MGSWLLIQVATIHWLARIHICVCVHCATIYYLLSTVDIGWERTVYTVTESTSVEVCGIIYSTILSRTVTVVVQSQDGTASTYVLVPVVILGWLLLVQCQALQDMQFRCQSTAVDVFLSLVVHFVIYSVLLVGRSFSLFPLFKRASFLLSESVCWCRYAVSIIACFLVHW